MSEFQEKIAECYFFKFGDTRDGDILRFKSRLYTILDRLYLYGSTLEIASRVDEIPLEKGELETLGVTIMNEAKAARLVIDKYRELKSD